MLNNLTIIPTLIQDEIHLPMKGIRYKSGLNVHNYLHLISLCSLISCHLSLLFKYHTKVNHFGDENSQPEMRLVNLLLLSRMPTTD